MLLEEKTNCDPVDGSSDVRDNNIQMKNLNYILKTVMKCTSLSMAQKQRRAKI